MPHFNHRSGLPSRVRNNDHTRWEKEQASWPVALFAAATLLFIVIGLFVPTN